jgi:hypothetical protein
VYYVQIEEDAKAKEDYEARQEKLAAENAKKRAEQEAAEASGLTIVKQKVESCSCIEGTTRNAVDASGSPTHSPVPLRVQATRALTSTAAKIGTSGTRSPKPTVGKATVSPHTIHYVLHPYLPLLYHE